MFQYEAERSIVYIYKLDVYIYKILDAIQIIVHAPSLTQWSSIRVEFLLSFVKHFLFSSLLMIILMDYSPEGTWWRKKRKLLNYHAQSICPQMLWSNPWQAVLPIIVYMHDIGQMLPETRVVCSVIMDRLNQFIEWKGLINPYVSPSRLLRKVGEKMVDWNKHWELVQPDFL